MINRYIVLEKRVGYTPLAELNMLKVRQPELAHIPMTYAGRLDPMASGKLLVLLGEECKRRKWYDGLQKEYAFEVVLGVSTDTGDGLGLPSMSNNDSAITLERVQDVCHNLIGSHILPYPHFSSKKVEGKPLFQHALEGTLEDIDLPTTNMRIFTLNCNSIRTISLKELIEGVLAKISMLHTEQNTGIVARDFRKGTITDAWNQLMHTDAQVTIVACTARVDAGTYIRSLAALMGERLGTRAFASSIHRSRIGRYIQLPFVGGVWIVTYD
jgi:tRNA pseudouridine(55) synthase